MFDHEDSNLKTLRVEITRQDTAYFYYKEYPKESEKFDKLKSILVFYFDNQFVTKDILKEYFSLLDKIDKIALGSFFNKKGSKAKRKIVYYAIITFKSILVSKIDNINFQTIVNTYLEDVKNRKLLVDFNPLREDRDNIFDEESFDNEKVDDDGFVTIKANNTDKTKFVSKNKDLSFGVVKENLDEEWEEIRPKRKKKRAIGGVFKSKEQLNKEKDDEIDERFGEGNKGFYNIQSYEKQKKKYNELKALFEQDKKFLSKKKLNN